MHQPTNNGMFERASGVAKATEFDVNGVLMDEVLKGENVYRTGLLYTAKECPHHAIEKPLLLKLSSYSQTLFFSLHMHSFSLFSLSHFKSTSTMQWHG